MVDDQATAPVFHHLSSDETLSHLSGSIHGLSHQEVKPRLEKYGRNALPRSKPPGLLRVFLH